jgi:hypothetical protein
MLTGASAALLGLLLASGCGRRATVPEEFPPVQLGMSRAETRDVVAGGGTRIAEDTPQMLRVTGRDSRVAEEVFLFYDGKLAAWTLRFAKPASRGSFQRVQRRLTLTFGEPMEERDDGLVLAARWRGREQGGRVLLSGFVGGRGGNAPLMVRVEDASVVRRLIRSLDKTAAAGSASSSPSGSADSTIGGAGP